MFRILVHLSFRFHTKRVCDEPRAGADGKGRNVPADIARYYFFRKDMSKCQHLGVA